MENFEYYSPTKVIFGKDAENSVGRHVKSFGGSRVLVHYGGGSAKKSGLVDRILAALEKEGLYCRELGGVVPNPRLGKVYEGIELCRSQRIDFVLGVGGGSAIDSAKAIAIGTASGGDVWDFFVRKRKPETSLPHAAVPTIAAAGSETSDSCVITKEEGLLKRGLSTPLNRCRFALMNPELTYTLPPYQTACGIVDMMMHTIERYFGIGKGNDFVDRLGEATLQAIIRSGAMAMAEPQSYEARANLMWAGSITHNGLTGTGRICDFVCHQLEHEMSALYDVAHGAGLAVVFPAWARYVLDTDVMRFAQYAVRVWGCQMDFEEPRRTALEGIRRTEDFFKSIGMPVTFKELGMTGSQIPEMAEKCTFFGKRKVGTCFRPLEEEDIRAIFERAKGE